MAHDANVMTLALALLCAALLLLRLARS